MIIALFGADPDLAACLVEQLDIPFGEGLANLDPTRITEQVCGTTILDVMSGG